MLRNLVFSAVIQMHSTRPSRIKLYPKLQTLIAWKKVMVRENGLVII